MPRDQHMSSVRSVLKGFTDGRMVLLEIDLYMQCFHCFSGPQEAELLGVGCLITSRNSKKISRGTWLLFVEG